MEAPASVQSLRYEGSQLHEANTEPASLRGVLAGSQGKLEDPSEQAEHNLSALKTQADVDGDMQHAAVRDCTRVQLLQDPERQECQSVESIITYLQTFVGRYSSLVDSAMASLYSDMRHGYETYYRSLLPEVARRIIGDCGAEYQSDVDSRLGHMSHL